MAQAAFAVPTAVKTEAQATDAYTGRVQAEGVASIGAAGHNAARQAALGDALQNVVASAGAQAIAGKLPDTANEFPQNPDAHPSRQGNRYSILREWESQGKYHVMVSAEVVKGEFDEKNAVLIQPPKKKIAITQFDVTNTIHVDDINNIYDGFPVALSNRMEASGRFLPAYAGRPIPMEAGAQQREAIIQVAGETGAQFLISGIIVNAGVSHGKWFMDAPKRHFEVELSIYDGFTGDRLMLRRLAEQAQGDVMVGNNKPFGSSIFFETEFGKAANRLIDSAVKEIQGTLENVPFSAHIIRAEGKKLFFDAGSDSLLKPGDKLVAYAIDTRAPVAGLQGSILGVTERAADTATLTHVNPQFSIGELPEDAEKLGIKAGNIARVNFADQHELAAKRVAARQLAKAQQAAKAETERVKAEQATQAEAARITAEQAALAKAARIKADKKAASEAKAAKLKAEQAAKTAKGNAAQQARARALAVKLKAAQKAKAQAAAKAAQLKDGQETGTETPQGKPEQKVQIQPKAHTPANNKAQQTANNEEAAEEKSKRKKLPPGEETLKGKPKPAKP
ncbi:MAG: hypothetical protein HY936_07310 [Nitrosomonadales bacterium]|nr:hypothetical protein [Nitrosomonadales bacterium]